MKTERIDKLYWRYIYENPDMDGWTAQTLAKRLEALGMLKLTEPTRYHYLPAFEPYASREDFKRLIPKLTAKGGRMKTVTKSLALILALGLTSCASEPKRGFDLPPALSEVFRNGELKGLENSTDGDLGIPLQHSRVQHVCVSKPLYDLYGNYYKTTVKCW